MCESNVASPILLTVDGISSSFSEVQPWNVLFPMDITELGIFNSINDEQL